MGDSHLTRTPIPVPTFFKQAEGSFSLKRRGRPGSHSLTPRPPVKTALPVSRVFPRRQQAWSHPRPQSVSGKESAAQRLSSRVYDESKEDLYFEQCFQKIIKLGHGSFGEVFKVRSKEDGKLYAVKRSMELFRGESDRSRKLEEAQKHERLGAHANLVGFVRAWEEGRRLYIQTELCDASLQQYAEGRCPLPERRVWAFLADLAAALKHLHDRGLAHMDVKPANVFVAGGRLCKLGDFGLLLELDGGDFSDAQEGDPKYMAPELLDGVYSKAADVFSLGMTILDISCNLELPRSGDGWQKLRQGYLPQEFVSGLSPGLLEVLRAMLQPDFRLRISVDKLLALPALHRVQRQRQIELLVHVGLNRALSLCRFLLSLLYYLWHAVSGPVNRLLSRRARTPPTSPVPTAFQESGLYSDWEDSSLGEDVFPLDPRTIPPKVLFPHQPEGPDPGEPAFLGNSVLLSPVNVSSRPSMGSTSTPRHASTDENPSLRRSSSRGSPNLSRISPDSPCGRFSPDPADRRPPSLEDDGLPLARGVFEPRNLLSLFDESMEGD
ncbi:membrane-associated tyrosine- and threonine-specific cdc2-inhibitory kinase [Carcharodon carcharias]|uniref:membrane-associated tyrosine- and threonine-specific cdc2-inhibitory kinase n=1 Tax=Carcharodon carcharias TaxID=13397 RepID=UPI001B7E8994|nr:membrane-associated tyrosine- and threonine-specific cdc2-inhibitory kinase [Carcharodon carcharias]